MTHITSRLTAKNWDQYGLSLPFYLPPPADVSSFRRFRHGIVARGGKLPAPVGMSANMHVAVRSAGRICAASKTNRQDECSIRTTSRLQTTQCRDSGVSMGWAGWTKSRGPRSRGFRVLSILYGHLVHVGETFNKFCAQNCTKVRLAAALRPDPLGCYSAPQTLFVFCFVSAIYVYTEIYDDYRSYISVQN